MGNPPCKPHTTQIFDTIAGEERPWFAMAYYCYHPIAAPAGKSALVVRLATTYDYWKALCAERQRYEAEKEQVGALVIAQQAGQEALCDGHSMT